jgi:beta-aspartyl-peptidase (threonine type)
LIEPALAVHAGAGDLARGKRVPARERACREGLASSLRVGHAVLTAGGSALDAVERAVRELEDCEEFNAGRGSVLTASGDIEMDAAIASGTTRDAGAVAAVRCIANPVVAARAVLEHSSHLLLVGEGAHAFARGRGIELCEDSDLLTEHRRLQLERARSGQRVSLDHDEDVGGTVGAVARDRSGGLAAATSTGGMTNQLAGRVGDTPLIGAGTWADDATCAVSGTGAGEAYIRCAFAHEIDALVRLGRLELDEACRRALDRVRSIGGSGGCIAVAPTGPPVLRFNSAGMLRGQVGASGAFEVWTFADA